MIMPIPWKLRQCRLHS